MKKMMIIISCVIAAAILYMVLAIFRPCICKADKLPSDCTIIAHRGGADLGAENTLSCFEKGIQAGADMIELDLHLTLDGHLVVCHDATVDRTTNGKGAIRKMTLEQVRALRIVHNGEVTEERIPTFSEVLDLAKGRCGVLVEIKRKKNWYPGIEALTLDTLRAKGFGPEDATLQSFDDSVLETFRDLGAEYPIEKLLFCKMPGLPLCFDMGFSTFSLEKYSYVKSFNFYYRSVTPKILDWLHENGFKVKVWTAPKPEKLRKMDYDGIITNCPDLYRQ